MKILITSDWYIPAVNGVVTSVKNLRRELERRGHEVRILTLSQTTRSGEKDGVIALGSIPAGLIYPGAPPHRPGRQVDTGAGGVGAGRGAFPV